MPQSRGSAVAPAARQEKIGFRGFGTRFHENVADIWVGFGVGPGTAKVDFFRNFSNLTKCHEMMGNGQKRAPGHVFRSNACVFGVSVALGGASRCISVCSEGCWSGREPGVAASPESIFSDFLHNSQKVMK